MNGTCNRTFFLVPRPLGPWGGAKGQISLNLNYLSQFQIFLNQSLCVFSQMKDIKHIRRNFIGSPGSCPRVCDLGVLGGQKFNFLNMVMWHIKLKGMNSSRGYTEKFNPTIKPVTLGCGQRVNYHYISSRAWGFAMARHRMCSSFFCQRFLSNFLT